ncbi:MAG: endolytic transglycosylase MltG, partial [Blastocatellia bacterium]|nr:endolytic transglycosylase MltG [Blastocatellia bacterium]
PIASSGLKSIDAALYPSEVDYLYFVANGVDGHHNFSRTESEHLTAVAAYRRQKKQQNQGN